VGHLPLERSTVTSKNTRLPPETDPPCPPDLSVLETRVPARLLRSLRIRAASEGKSVDDVVREAIEERLKG